MCRPRSPRPSTVRSAFSSWISRNRSRPRRYLSSRRSSLMSRTLAEPDAEPGETADDVTRLPPRLLDRLHPGEAFEEPSERRLQFEAPERRAETEVDPGAEAQMRVRCPPEVHVVGLVEDLWVAVRRSEDESELGAARDRRAMEIERLEDPSLEQLQRGVEPQQLFDRRGDEGVLGTEPLQLVGVAEERPPAEERGVHGGLVAGVEQQHARPDELVLREAFTLVRDLDQLGDQIVAGVLRALACERAQVVRELEARAHRGGLGLCRRVELVHPTDVGGPRAEQMTVRGRYAQHLRDHGDRQRLGDRREQVDLAG